MQKGNVKCGHKYCGKLGHTTSECRKRKRDEENKTNSNKRSKNQQGPKAYSKSKIRCHKCKELGHYANKCPLKDSKQQQAHRATIDTKVSQMTSTTKDSQKRNFDEMIMMAVCDAPTRWNTRPQ
jgi:hypothetical protein